MGNSRISDMCHWAQGRHWLRPDIMQSQGKKDGVQRTTRTVATDTAAGGWPEG